MDCSFACWLLPQPIPTICYNADGRGVAHCLHPCLPLYISRWSCWRGFGASVPHMNCMAWIQQSSCSKALLPQRCFSAIKEYSSPSCPLSCTAVLAQFGSLFPLPLSSLFYSSESVIYTTNRSPCGDRETSTDV